jgi:CubicO group peptidase (beta-lactamase class C family)
LHTRFENELEDLRQLLKIPGMSSAIVKGQEVAWAKGFGYAGLENKIEARPDTRYHLASLTKLFAGILIMQLVEEGVLDLQNPVAGYGVRLKSLGLIRVKHLLSMTSEGHPGRQFRYSGDRFSYLTQVMERASGRSFTDLLAERILEPLGLTDTAPSLEFQDEDLARPYTLDNDSEIIPGTYSTHLSAAAGLVSTVSDLARFDIALDQNALVSQETKDMIFAPTIATTGAELPYGLAWFTQRYLGTRLLWAYGWWDCVSSLFLKAPDEDTTFIILANTDSLNRPYDLGSGKALVVNSPVAMAFYKLFVPEATLGQRAPAVAWEASEAELLRQLDLCPEGHLKDILERELYSRRKAYESVGEWRQASRLLNVAMQAFSRSSPLRDSA